MDFFVYLAASIMVILASVAQEYEGKPQHVAYHSQKLNEPEKKYTWMDHSCLALAGLLKKFHHYLVQTHNIFYIEKSALKLLLTTMEPPPRVMKWLL